MAQTLAHGIEIKKPIFQVDSQLVSLKNFKGVVLKSSEIKDYSQFKDKHIALIGFNSSILEALDKALPYAGFIKLFCENPTWVLKPYQSVFSILSPFQSEKIDRIRQDNEQTGFFTVSAKNKMALYPVKVAQRNLKQIKNPWLARQLTPNHLNLEHTFIFNKNFYTNVQNPRVKVITWPLVQVFEDNILAMEGIHHLVDVIITAD